MTKEIINSDGSRNWRANILLDNIERLEQENKELKKQIESDKGLITIGGKQQYEMTMAYDKFKTALEEIRNNLKEVCKEECDYTKPKFCGDCDCRYGQILTKINEVLE